MAALAVVAYHGAANANVWWVGHWAPTPVRSIMNNFGQLGVAMFFVLSGFLLFRPYAAAQLSGVRVPALGPFWARRAARIFPAYWVAVTAALLLGVFFTTGSFLRDVLLAYPLVHNYWYGGGGLIGIGVSWTLVIEVSFYVTLPVFAYGIRSLERILRVRAVTAQIFGVAALAMVGIISRTVWLFVIGKNTPPSRPWFPLNNLGYWLPSYLDWFAVGMLLAVASAWRDAGGSLPRVLRALAHRLSISWSLGALAMVAATRAGVPVLKLVPIGPVAEWSRDACSLLAASLLVLPTLVPGRRADPGRRLLVSRPLVLLGTISYGIYLWNNIWYRYFEPFGPSPWMLRGLLAYVGVVVTLTIVVAYASYVLLERPVLEAVHRAFGTTRRGDASGRRPHWRIPVGAERRAVVEWVDTETPLSPAFVTVVWVVAAGALGALAWTLPTLRAAIG